MYVRFPKEMGLGGDFVARLDKCMYGTRDAGSIWEGCYTDALVAQGFIAGKASPCCFYHPILKVSVVIHGDDFTALGTDEALDQYEKELCKVLDVKVRGRIGSEEGDMKEMKILNRIVRITPEGLMYEADPRHAELLAQSLGLTDSKSVVTPGVKQTGTEEEAVKINQDADDDIAALRKPVTMFKKPANRHKKVTFDTNVESRDVEAYSSIYGYHPRQIIATRYGNMKVAREGVDPYTAKSIHVMNARKTLSRLAASGTTRKAILEHTLLNGSAWEARAETLMSKIFAITPPTKPKKKKGGKRAGAKAVKQMERLASPGLVLNADEATSYRALAARVNYLALDRVELAFAAKELCREFSAPTKHSWERLKRAVRFLVGRPRVIWQFLWQARPDCLDGYVDTDFAGCQATRRSTSGGAAMYGSHLVKHWSQTQTTVALSSGEAELTGICKGASTCIGLQSVAKDLGFHWPLEIHSDATAAIGICNRRGLGEIRH